ncbi:MAG: GH3 auxin-responsive promoter family protein [Bermanella sp.]
MFDIKVRIKKTAYPIIMALAFICHWSLMQSGLSLTLASSASVSLALILILLLEKTIPFNIEWKPSLNEIKNDLFFLTLIQMLLPRILALLVVIFLSQNILNWQATHNIWPTDSPLLVQLCLMILVADFLRYWLHVACHKIPFLWRFHSIHHSPEKLYCLNVARFHPLEKSMQYVFDSLPFILLGVSPDLFALYFVFYAVNGFFQHANIDLRHGPLNWLISTCELHRWHHASDVNTAMVNYGNNIILWDLLFGTSYLPKEQKDKSVNLSPIQLGLKDQSHDSFIVALCRPFKGTGITFKLWRYQVKNHVTSLIFNIWVRSIRYSLWRPMKISCAQPQLTQLNLLKTILQTNQTSTFAKEHNFSHISSHEDFVKNVPVQDYDSLQPYIQQQEISGDHALTCNAPAIYAQTSGTTGSVKKIPILSESIKQLKKSQSLAAFMNYQCCPKAFSGMLLAIVSPAIEGYTDTGHPYGSVSGLLVKNMPKIAKAKYVLPAEIFEISDYEIKYYLILRLALAHKNITFLGAANPSTFIRLLQIINEKRHELLADMKEKYLPKTIHLPNDIKQAIEKKTHHNPKRYRELKKLFNEKKVIEFKDIWPNLNLTVTWTQGSCGIPLNAIRPSLPAHTKVMDVGYLASEFRGTITLAPGLANLKEKENKTDESLLPSPLLPQGLPCISETFYEFVERSVWDNRPDQQDTSALPFLLLHQLEVDREYYIIISNGNGLYRYFMNDLVTVDGHLLQTPTLKFLQKGKGVTNITGEKLYESQLIEAVKRCESQLNFNTIFYVMLAQEENQNYQLFLQVRDNDDESVTISALEKLLDKELKELNIEYKCKRDSGRLSQASITLLQYGSFDHFKKHLLNQGNRESQLKFMTLLYARDNSFSFEDFSKQEIAQTTLPNLKEA